jgi:hypothetical protein
MSWSMLAADVKEIVPPVMSKSIRACDVISVVFLSFPRAL